MSCAHAFHGGATHADSETRDSAPVSIVPFRIGTSARMPVEDLRAAHAAAVAGATAA